MVNLTIATVTSSPRLGFWAEIQTFNVFTFSAQRTGPRRHSCRLRKVLRPSKEFRGQNKVAIQEVFHMHDNTVAIAKHNRELAWPFSARDRAYVFAALSGDWARPCDGHGFDTVMRAGKRAERDAPIGAGCGHVNMARNDLSYVGVTQDGIGKCVVVLQDDKVGLHVKGRNVVVQNDNHRRVRHLGKTRFQPTYLAGLQSARAVQFRIRCVEHDHPVVACVNYMVDTAAVGIGVSGPHHVQKRRSVVVIAQGQVDRRGQRRDGRFEPRVGGGLSMIGEVPGKDNEIGVRVYVVDVSDGPVQTVQRIEPMAQLAFGNQVDVGENDEFLH